MITTNEKVEIFQAAKAQMREWYGAGDDDLPEMTERGACLYWTQVAMRELIHRGHRAIIQAGTMYWQIRPQNHEANAFGYEWSPHLPQNRAQIEKGELPEMHIWAAVPDEGLLVDFSTAYLPHIAKKYYGLEWLTAPPPEYIFGPPPKGALYAPNIEAIRFAINFLNEKVLA